MNIKKNNLKKALKHPAHVCAGLSFQGQLDLARKFQSKQWQLKDASVTSVGLGKFRVVLYMFCGFSVCSCK